MLSISAIKGKFKRSGIDFKKTFLFDEYPFSNEKILKQFRIDEKCIIYFIRDTSYSWYLTNKGLLIPSENKYVELSSLTKIDFLNIKENPTLKTANTELTLFTINDELKFYVEEKSWHLFYSIFKFIIESNIE